MERNLPPLSQPLVSVVVPAYNEARNIRENLTQIYEYLQTKKNQFRWELIIVDDGSVDGTGRIIDEFAQTRPEVLPLHHFVNFNLGQALRFAFNRCRGDYVVTLDSDLSYSPDHIGILIETIIQTKAKIVIASPYMQGGRVSNVPWLRRILSRWGNRFLNFPLNEKIHTMTGMVRAYDGTFIRNLNLKSMDAGINLEVIYKARFLNARILEIPAHLNWHFNRDGAEKRKSSLRLGRSLSTCLFYGIVFNPLLFFLLPGGLLLALFLVMVFWSGSVALQTITQPSALGGGGFLASGGVGPLTFFPPGLLFVSGITFLFACLLIGVGILILLGKYYFEELFHLGTSTYKGIRGREGDR